MRKIITLVLVVIILLSTIVNAEPNKEIKLKDISNHWSKESIEYILSKGIIKGFPDETYRPEFTLTRAEFVKMLVEAMKYRHVDALSFNDLKPFPTSKPHWACVYIETALRNGVISKDEIGENFFPDVPLTRKDMGMMMFRALKLTPSEGANPFADLTEADGYLTKLYEEYLIRGSIEGGKRLYKSEGLTTRAEAAVIIARMLEYKANPSEYVKTAGLEIRLREGIATEEDIKLNREIEYKKQAEDKTYIVEPRFSVEKSPEKMYFEKFMYSYIHLDNYTEYADEIELRAICISDKTQNMSYSQNAYMQWHESYKDVWVPLQRLKEHNISIIYMVPKRNIKKVGTEYTGYYYNYKSETVLIYEVQLKRGNIVKKYTVNVVIP